MSDSYLAIWKCLESEPEEKKLIDEEIENTFGPNHPDPDVFSLNDVIGIDISDSHQAASATLHVTEHDTNSVSQWLNQEPTIFPPNTPTRLRILVGDQIMRNDGLRPPFDLRGTDISRSLLTSCFNIPAVALPTIGGEVARSTTYPPVPGMPITATCHAVVGALISAAWSHDSATGTTTAIIIIRWRSGGAARRKILKLLETLNAFSSLPGFIPYIILSTMLDYANTRAIFGERESESDDRIIMGNLHIQQKRPFEMFGFAAMRLHDISTILKYASVVLQMSKRLQICPLLRPSSVDEAGWERMQRNHESIQLLSQFRQEELEQLITHCNFLKSNLVALQSTVMGMMSFKRQELSQEIAEATHKDGRIMKEIAEATKKDSTSMKILALMTMVFLPSTTVSTILAIPSMFDFSNKSAKQPLVSSQLWIFFAVSIPLTILTMLLTWSWLKWESNGRRVHWPSLRLRRQTKTESVLHPSKMV